MEGMKRCAYCGKENIDEATNCAECGSPDLRAPDDSAHEQSIPQIEQGFVTLTTCRTLPEADLLVSELESAGIPAFIPDECLMQNAPITTGFGYIRVQVVPKDYAEARDFLLAKPLPPPIPEN
jgi:hypothetical protein